MLRSLTLVLLLLTSTPAWAQGRFVLTWLGPGPSEEISFFSQDVGWMASPRLLRTRDGGGTWQAQGVLITSMDFLSASTGWLVGVQPGASGGVAVGVTKDGGKSCAWHPVKAWVQDIAGLSATEAWAIGVAQSGRAASVDGVAVDPGLALARLLHTVDGGKTWVPFALHAGGGLLAQPRGVAFRDRRHGWVVGWALRPPRGMEEGVVVWRTTDGGRSFTKTAALPVRTRGAPSWPIHFVDDEEGWIAVDGPSLLHTRDGGKTWEAVTPRGQATDEGSIALSDCSFPTAKAGWAVGAQRVASNGEFPSRRHAVALYTQDGGSTWEVLGTDVSGLPQSWLTRVSAVDESHAWAVGGGGEPDTDIGLPARGPFYTRGFVLKYLPDAPQGPATRPRPRRGG